MKKILAFTVLIAMLLSFAACDEATVDEAATPTATMTVEPTAEPTPTPTAEPTPAVTGEAYSFGGITMTLPEGFTKTEQNGIAIIYTDKYPEATDNIVITTAGADSIAAYTKENLESVYRDSLAGFQSMSAFEKIDFAGVDTIKVTYTVEANGITMTQTQYMMFMTTSSTIITFTEVSGEYTTVFDNIASTVKVN